MVESGDTSFSGVTVERSPSDHNPESDTALAAPPSSLIGQTLGGRYRVTSLLGSGGMGAVYRAEHMELRKTVALKVLNQEMASHREAALRFEREAMVSAQIQHPNVVSATDSGRLPDGSLYLVLEYVSGRSLRDLVNAEGRLAPPRALAIGAQIAEALGAAHRAQVVHRDLKPGNVMLLTEENNPEFVKVLDFGLARVAGDSAPGEPLTRTGSVFGTPEYMSPEQARGEVVDHRADLYALGVILYELLSGRQPFMAPELVAILIKHIQEAPPPLPADVPVPIAQYVMSLLDKEPSRRPGDARQVAKALRKLAPPPGGVPSTAPPSAAYSTQRVPKTPGSLQKLGGALQRVEWRALARGSQGWLSRAGQAIASASPSGLRRVTALIGQSLGVWLVRPLGLMRQHRFVVIGALLGFALTIVLGLSWGKWGNAVPDGLPERARQGEPAALGELAAVSAPDRGARASIALAVGYFSSAQYKEGLEALEDALDIDPSVGNDPAILAGVRKAVDVPTTRETALELAAKRLGKPGGDLLFDVWRSTNAKTPATRAARQWLDSDGLRANAGAALLLALQIREAKTCSAFAELLPRLTKEGDDRSLLPLRRLQSGSGCGFLGLEDCYPCLRQGTALDDAIAAVSARPAPKF
jgi:serine/threonine protein kinase